MKIKDIINNKKVTVSFEVFPPKQWDKIANTKKIVEEMVKDKPSFMSVTTVRQELQAVFQQRLQMRLKRAELSRFLTLPALLLPRKKSTAFWMSWRQTVLKTCLL